MIRNFEYLTVFTSAPGVLSEQNDGYQIQPWKVNEIKAYKKRKKMFREIVHENLQKLFLKSGNYAKIVKKISKN